MNRPSFALSVLLATLAGSFVLVGSANSQVATVRVRSACYATWPIDADLYGYDYGHCKYAAGWQGSGGADCSLADPGSELSLLGATMPEPTVKPAEPAALSVESATPSPVITGEVPVDLAASTYDEWSPPLAGPPVADAELGDEFDYDYATQVLDDLDAEVARAIARCAPQGLPLDLRTGYDVVYDVAVYGSAREESPLLEDDATDHAASTAEPGYWAEPAAASLVSRLSSPVIDLLKDALRVDEFTATEAGCGMDMAKATNSYLSNLLYNFKQDFSCQYHAATLTPAIESAPTVDGPQVEVLGTLVSAIREASPIAGIVQSLRVQVQEWTHRAAQTQAAGLARRAASEVRAFQAHVNEYFEPTQEVSTPAPGGDFGCWQ